MKSFVLLCCVVFFFVECVIGLEGNKNWNTDFLSYESGKNPPAPRRDYVANPQFPALGSSTAGTTANPGSPTKVKDLVNFYDRQGNGQGSSPKPPSYSSIVQGSKQQVTTKPVVVNGHGGLTSSTTKIVQPITPSPINGNKVTVPSSPTSSTIGQFNKGVTIPPYKPATHPSSPTASTIGQFNKGPTLPFNKPVTHPSPATPGKPTASTYMPTKPPLSFSAVVAGGNKNPSTVKPLIMPSSIANKRPGQNKATTEASKLSNSKEPTDAELQILSEELLKKDTNNAAKLITVNYQGRTSSQSKDDKAAQPLLTIPDSVWNIPTVQKFVPLLDNYERDSLINEYVTPLERNEENAFMDAIMSTTVIRHLMTFLKDKGYVTPDPKQQRDFLKQLWFNLYSRGKGKIGSSGFEHTFVSELKNGDVSGLHNWLYFSKEESANRLNYLGYLKHEEFGDKGAVIKMHFNQLNSDKPVDTMFIGTSPELEVALYSLCFITRADRDCPLKLNGKNVNIVTYKFRYRSKDLIGSAYPQI